MSVSEQVIEAWQHQVECEKCGDIIWSRRPGQFVTCKCGAISVDSTPHYTRYIGNPEDFKHNNKNDS